MTGTEQFFWALLSRYSKSFDIVHSLTRYLDTHLVEFLLCCHGCLFHVRIQYVAVCCIGETETKSKKYLKNVCNGAHFYLFLTLLYFIHNTFLYGCYLLLLTPVLPTIVKLVICSYMIKWRSFWFSQLFQMEKITSAKKQRITIIIIIIIINVVISISNLWKSSPKNFVYPCKFFK